MGTDATAAAAIDRLEDFRRAQVGEDRANSTKPLRRARLALESAADRLAATRDRHAAYLDLVAEVDAARDRADRADALARPLVAAVAAGRAEAAVRNADRAAELAARYPEGAPSGIVARDELSDRVAAVLDAWDSRPTPVSLEGDGADVLATPAGEPADRTGRRPRARRGGRPCEDRVRPGGRGPPARRRAPRGAGAARRSDPTAEWPGPGRAMQPGREVGPSEPSPARSSWGRPGSP